MSVVRRDLSIEGQVDHAAAEYGPEFTRQNLALVLSLYRTMTVLDRAQVEELGAVGLTVSQFNVLTVLHRAEALITMSELAEAVAVRPTNLTNVVNSLFGANLVHRDVNPSDRRSLLVSITDEGNAFLAEFLPSHWRRMDLLLSGLSMPDREELASLLGELRCSVERVTLDGHARADKALPGRSCGNY